MKILITEIQIKKIHKILLNEEEYNLNNLKLYHASPYKFFDFDIKKINSGSGKQINGWGLYFSNNKNTIQSYGENIYTVKLIKDKNITLLDLNKPIKKDLFINILESLYKYKNEDFNIYNFNKFYDFSKKYEELKKNLLDNLKKIDPNLEYFSLSEILDIKNKNNWFYITNYTKNNKKIESIFNEIKNISKIKFNTYNFDINSNAFFIYKNLSIILNGDKNASLFLLNIGVDGLIRKENNKNIDFIIFNDKLIKIIEHENINNRKTNK